MTDSFTDKVFLLYNSWADTMLKKQKHFYDFINEINLSRCSYAETVFMYNTTLPEETTVAAFTICLICHALANCSKVLQKKRKKKENLSFQTFTSEAAFIQWDIDIKIPCSHWDFIEETLRRRENTIFFMF